MAVRDGHEAGPRKALRPHIQPHHRILEIGAGIGGVTSDMEAVAELVVACEPQPTPYCKLVENTIWAVTLPVAVSVDEQPLRMWIDNEWHNSQVDERGCLMPTVCIKRLLDGFDIYALVLDCEGYEEKLLNETDLEGLELVAFEQHPKKFVMSELERGVERLTNAGFELVEQREAHPEPGLDYLVFTR